MTIKTRLTLLFAGVVALLLLALMWSLYAYTSYHRSASFSSQLFVRALTAATVALENDEMSVPALRPFQQKLQNYQLPEESITIFDERNLPYFHSGLGSLGIDQELRRRAIAHAGLSLVKGDTQVVYFPYEDNGHLYIVEASAVDVAGLDSLQRLLATFAR